MRDISKSLVRRAYVAFLKTLEDKPSSVLDDLFGQDKPEFKPAKGMMAKKNISAKGSKEETPPKEGEHIQYAKRLRQLRLARKAMMENANG